METKIFFLNLVWFLLTIKVTSIGSPISQSLLTSPKMFWLRRGGFYIIKYLLPFSLSKRNIPRTSYTKFEIHFSQVDFFNLFAEYVLIQQKRRSYNIFSSLLILEPNPTLVFWCHFPQVELWNLLAKEVSDLFNKCRKDKVEKVRWRCWCWWQKLEGTSNKCHPSGFWWKIFSLKKVQIL